MGIPQYGNGPYRFVLCNPSQGAALINLFQTTGRALEQQIYPEALKGPKSLAFKTFFSTNSATTIANVFSDINLGATTKSVDRKSTKPPVFACVNPETDIGMVHWAQWTCQKFGYTAFMETSGLFVFFCPSFWNNNMNLDGPHSVYCPKLNRDGTAYATDGIGVGTGKYLNKNRVATIIHELAHTYSTNVGSDEVYALNEIIKREPAFQLGNPSNYMYFSSCTYDFHKRHSSRKDDSRPACDVRTFLKFDFPLLRFAFY